MASLASGIEFGNASPTSLVKSAATLERELASFDDQEAAITYENSAKTQADLDAYTSYLNGRVSTLTGDGSTISDQTKALTLSQDIVSATHANISADIQRENINLMSTGIASTPSGYQQKMGVVAGEYTRALSIGDDALAQSLMSQYYSLSQSYQSAVATAASASSTLAKASGTATYESEVVTNLTDTLKSFVGTAKNLSENELNSDLASFAKTNAGTLGALGVKIQGNQPNYWDVTAGIAGAIYNAKVLQAQAESATNPLVAESYATEAQNYLNGSTKFQTLAGDLTVQQITEAQSNPQMFSYDNSTGTYKMTTQTGYQYMPMTDANGSTSNVLVPTYSGMVSKGEANKVLFLSPTQTTEMTKLGLNFSENTSGKNKGTTGDGVEVQLNDNAPNWLKQIAGQGSILNMYTQNNGFLQFKAGSTTGQGDAYYTVASDERGLQGVYEHNPDGSIKLAGGDYGFDSSAVNLLINNSQQTQYNVSVEQAQIQQQLQLAQQKAQAALRVAAPAAPAPAAKTTQVQRLQPAIAPQVTFNPQGNNVNPQNAGQNTVQTTVSGNDLNQSGSGGIKLGSSSGAPGIKL